MHAQPTAVTPNVPDPIVSSTFRGFTLVELMIVVAIIAILAAIVLPGYQDAVWKSRRGEGKAAILRALQSEERFYTLNNTYVLSASAAGVAIPSFSGDSLAKSSYAIDANVCTNGLPKEQCINVTATTIGSVDPKCGNTLSMDSMGVKANAASAPGCW